MSLQQRMKKFAAIVAMAGALAAGLCGAAMAAEEYKLVSRWGGSGTGDGQFKDPVYINIDNLGNFYVSDTGGHRVQKFSPNGGFLMKIGSYGVGDGQFNAPTGVAVDASGNIYVGDHYNRRIQKFSSTGAFLKRWGNEGLGNGQFTYVRSLQIGKDGNLYVLENRLYPNNARVQVFTPEGVFVRAFGLPSSVGSSMAVDAIGNLYITRGYCEVLKYSPEGAMLLQFGEEGRGDGQMEQISGVGVDRLGYIYTSDMNYQKREVQKYSPTGQFITRWTGNGVLWEPQTIVADAQGKIFVVDNFKEEVFVFSNSVVPTPTPTSGPTPTATPVPTQAPTATPTPVTSPDVTPTPGLCRITSG